MTILKTTIDKFLKMKKSRLNKIFLLVIFSLIVLFIYSGFKYEETINQNMIWKSGRFKMTNVSKLIGILFLMSFPTYLIIKNKLKDRIDN